MHETSDRKFSHKKRSRFIDILKSSVILVFLDKICCKIYDLLTSGFFARILGGYSVKNLSFSKEESFFSRQNRKIKDKLSGLIERSPIVNAVEAYKRRFLKYRLRVVGIFLMTFGVYTGVFSFIKSLFVESSYDKYRSYIISAQAIVLILLSIPFIISKTTLQNAVAKSKIASRTLELLGFDGNFRSLPDQSGSSVLALILGIAAGTASLIIEPLFIIGGLVGIILIYAVLSTPEFGAMLLFFLIPLVSTKALIALVLLVAFSFAAKIIRSKRVFRFEKVDFFVAVFAVMTVLGGLVSLSIKSIEPAVLYACFIGAYFIVACCIRSRKWLMRCMTAAIVSALLVSFYGIIQYVLGDTLTASWLDADMFGDITGRAIATLENPNMLGEYLIMIIPMAAALCLSGEWIPRKSSFGCFACMCMCLILTWSRGAWLGFMFGFLILILIWNKRSIWLVMGGVLSIPLLSVVLPDSIINRFTSIGNLADKSTSYRVSIWRGAMHMARDNIFSGIGVGKAAWSEMYGEYALPGIDAASHAHNLFIQITLELGIFGLIVFLIALFLMYQSGFTLFSRFPKNSVDEVHLSDKSDNALCVRMSVAGPMCGIIGALVQGLTDYSWYNYRVTLMFWLVIGLSVALTKNGREYAPDYANAVVANLQSADKTEASMDVAISDD